MRTYILLSALALSTAACATSAPVLKPASSGASAANLQAQAIAPDPAQKANRHIPQDRTLRDAARKRYRQGMVKEPVSTQTNE